MSDHEDDCGTAAVAAARYAETGKASGMLAGIIPHIPFEAFDEFPPPPRCDECGKPIVDDADLVMFDDEQYCLACWEADEL